MGVFFCFTCCGVCTPKDETLSEESRVETMEQATKNTTESTEATEENTYTENDEGLDVYQYVDKYLLELCESEEYINSTYNQQVELVLSVLEELESQNYIIEGSIVYYENQAHVAFKNINGALGGFDFKEFNSRYN